MHGGQRIAILGCGPGGIALERKEVLLLNSDEPLWGIGYLF